MYAMQRANGDWFAVKAQGRRCVPVFPGSSEAMQARARNTGMLLFKPVVIDEHALKDLAPTDDERDTDFWLVDNPSDNLNRSRPLDYAQLILLINEETEPSENDK
jgi:hypothetical protein